MLSKTFPNFFATAAPARRTIQDDTVSIFFRALCQQNFESKTLPVYYQVGSHNSIKEQTNSNSSIITVVVLVLYVNDDGETKS